MLGLRLQIWALAKLPFVGIKDPSGSSPVYASAATVTLSGGASGSVSKSSADSYTASIKDLYDNIASPTFSLSGDASGITVDGGSAGKGIDGYIEGTRIFADNDGDGTLTAGDSPASTNPTGVYKLYGASGPLIMSGGTDKATGLSFDVQYEAPAGYTVINPISSIIRAIETKDQVNTGEEATKAAEAKMASAIGATVNFSSFDAYNSVSLTQYQTQ